MTVFSPKKGCGWPHSGKVSEFANKLHIYDTKSQSKKWLIIGLNMESQHERHKERLRSQQLGCQVVAALLRTLNQPIFLGLIRLLYQTTILGCTMHTHAQTVALWHCQKNVLRVFWIMYIYNILSSTASMSTNTNAGASHTSRIGPSGWRMGNAQQDDIEGLASGSKQVSGVRQR